MISAFDSTYSLLQTDEWNIKDLKNGIGSGNGNVLLKTGLRQTF